MDTMARLQLVRRVPALALAALFLAAPLGVVSAAKLEDSAPPPQSQDLSPEQKFARRYPQPVTVGFLVGLPVLDGQRSTYGTIREVVRTAEGKILLVVA